jgi:hypothetical protein
VSNVDNYPAFRQALLFPSSERICNGWVFLKPSVGQAAAGELDVLALIGGAGSSSNPPKTRSHYIFDLKITTAVFAETLDNFKHLSLLIPES